MAAIFTYETQLNGSTQLSARSQALRIDTEDGIPIQLKRFEKQLFTQPAQFILTPAQEQTFITTWYPTNGHTWFDYPESHSGTTVQGRIVGGDYTLAPMSHQHGRYLLSFNVEYVQ